MLPSYQIENQILSNLSYADDFAIMSYYRTHIQNILNVLAKDALEAENFKNETDKHNFNLELTIHNEQITQVTEFLYLGHKLSSNNKGMVAMQHRIALV